MAHSPEYQAKLMYNIRYPSLKEFSNCFQQAAHDLDIGKKGLWKQEAYCTKSARTLDTGSTTSEENVEHDFEAQINLLTQQHSQTWSTSQTYKETKNKGIQLLYVSSY